ncbi:hypothetical protein GCM10025868_33700 [Angustibacter aerolatus]|uniref:UbiC transcription regulator-associated domain-containing protein n=1 Tax=Angustibacter aerolatus TaxID=1162965 RepID=A0ABQ6JMX8_9ACTN|nr:hypothetical protein GCM10025868_33700 [Angustibacter aerolatus]
MSRPTVRRAIGDLVAQGLLVRQRGVGTQVASRMVHRRARLTSLYDDLAREGRTPTTQVLAVDPGVQDARACAALGLEPGTPLLRVDRLRLAGGEPLALMRNWLPPRFADLSRDDLEGAGLYTLLRERGGQPTVARQQPGRPGRHGRRGPTTRHPAGRRAADHDAHRVRRRGRGHRARRPLLPQRALQRGGRGGAVVSAVASGVLRVGVVGLGVMGRAHAQVLQALPGVAVTAVADVSDAAVAAVVERTGAVGTGDGLQAAAGADVDALVVASPDATHAALVRAALDRDLPVLCEKPLTTSVADSAALVEPGVGARPGAGRLHAPPRPGLRRGRRRRARRPGRRPLGAAHGAPQPGVGVRLRAVGAVAQLRLARRRPGALDDWLRRRRGVLRAGPGRPRLRRGAAAAADDVRRGVGERACRTARTRTTRSDSR